MELWQLRTFAEIAETLNFTKASENLHLTQSAVSHQIKALEDELGVRLFIRGKRGVSLTDAGEAALEHAKSILSEADKMQKSVVGRELGVVGKVRVAAATQALVHLFAPLFEKFMDANENVDLVFRTTVMTEQTIEDILNGVADVGFASLPVYSPNLDVEELFEDELYLIFGKKHKSSSLETVPVKDLEHERWVLFERGASIRRATDKFFKKLNFEPEMALESNDTYFIKLMVEHGLGITLMPLWTVRQELNSGRLDCAKIKGHRLKRSVAMVSLRGNPSAPIRAFTSHILDNRGVLKKLAVSRD